jgi:hypothetical protein
MRRYRRGETPRFLKLQAGQTARRRNTPILYSPSRIRRRAKRKDWPVDVASRYLITWKVITTLPCVVKSKVATPCAVS